MTTDPRRFIPKMDEILQYPAVQDAQHRLAPHSVRAIIDAVLADARRGSLAPSQIEGELADRLEVAQPHSLRRVINATGVIIHTNLGRAPLPPAAVDALVAAAGYTDVEMDLDSGQRSRDRGRAAIDAVLAACPGAEDALVVNNGASALLLATAALAPGKEVIISRGELIEIGAGFRLPELIESTATRLREVGATNRTHLADYERAMGEDTGAILKVHPSNFVISGFTSSVSVAELRALTDLPLIVDIGSGLLSPDNALPAEPSASEALRDGADLVLFSGDKLLGGPQAGVLVGQKEAIAACKKHPLARAVRIDKLRLNALEASLATYSNAVQDALHIDPQRHRERTEKVAAAVGGEVVEHAGRVGGGGAPEVPLPGWAVALPEELARPLRLGEPPVVARVNQGRCLVDVRCVPEAQDAELIAALRAVI
ncbi:L-seryl-tRNA(Sec) selenium transferase [Corynebacterium aurimucosum]|uniref:L-seryl-tRNA(Sec) selenium transferase n=1 Tax=Corynebacterium aurimucosum (strain ATCC 700975 / DSM 44827 / CIP 107346 / CN-1) TaxID=548476 RepID=C3PFG0_CORA7|nr:L-seryl-tRNA(Sec) selenium transferase [Corynebacterium aurimucosum]ACP32564.1 selenocysteine synthase [Corynebacterium aurimucosum ATCC 700975]QQU93260.1 L-seryl-tRNA(Sec) selenium transferase [Corynebacterium aurimucosum]